MKRNKKGFTLVELLAVIVVLGVILAIATTSVIKVIKTNRAKTFSKTMDVVVQSAKGILVGKEIDVCDSDSDNCAEAFKSKLIESLNISENDYEISVSYSATDKTYTITLSPKSDKFKNMDLADAELGDGIIIIENKLTYSLKDTRIVKKTKPDPPQEDDDPKTVDVEKNFSCCPANVTKTSHDFIAPYYKEDNGYNYCDYDYATYSRFEGDITESRLNYVGLGKLAEKLFNNVDYNTYATLMCTPKFDDRNKNYAFSIEGILDGLGRSGITSVEDCIKNNYCVPAKDLWNTEGTMLYRDYSKKISLGDDLYVIFRDLEYKEKIAICDEVKPDAILNGAKCLSSSEHKEMADSKAALIFDRKKILTDKDGKEMIKELYFAFLISNDEWNRYVRTSNGILKRGRQYSVKSDITIFKYKYGNTLTEYTIGIGKGTENGALANTDYGLGR